jgi:hypothetical protein
VPVPVPVPVPVAVAVAVAAGSVADRGAGPPEAPGGALNHESVRDVALLFS